MLIGFIGSQSGMTNFQIEELPKRLAGCTELVHCDIIGATKIACNIAVEQLKIQQFTVHPIVDNRKRIFFADPEKRTKYNKIETPYIDYHGYKVKWTPIDSYFNIHDRMINTCGVIVAAPKEHKFAINSAVWGVIRRVWKLKKDIIIIPPIER